MPSEFALENLLITVQDNQWIVRITAIYRMLI